MGGGLRPPELVGGFFSFYWPLSPGAYGGGSVVDFLLPPLPQPTPESHRLAISPVGVPSTGRTTGSLLTAHNRFTRWLLPRPFRLSSVDNESIHAPEPLLDVQSTLHKISGAGSFNSYAAGLVAGILLLVPYPPWCCIPLGAATPPPGLGCRYFFCPFPCGAKDIYPGTCRNP